MISQQIAALYGTLELRTGRWDATLKRIEAQLRGLTRGTFTVRIQVQGLQDVQLLVQQLQQLRGLAGRPFSVNARVNAQGGGGMGAGGFGMLGGSPLKSNFVPQMGVGISAGTAAARMAAQQARAQAAGRAAMMARRAAMIGNAGQAGVGAMHGMGMPFAMNPWMAGGTIAGLGLAGAARTGIRTEASMASLRAISGLSPSAIAALKGQLQGAAVELPGLNRSGAFGIAEVGARAGVAGADLGTFTRGLAKISAATPDADPEKLAEDVVRTMNVFNMSMDRVESFGSALVALDQASVAHAKEILDMTRRMAGSGQAAGLSLEQTMALSAAMRSVGVRSESGTTAMGRILTMMSNDPGQLEAGLGMGRGQLSRMMAHDPMDALGALFSGVGSARGNRLQFVTQELGFDNQRDIQLVGQLGGRMGDVRRLTGMARDQLAGGGALDERLDVLGESTAASLEKLSDAFGSLADAITSPLIGLIGEAASGLGSFVGGLASFLEWLNLNAGQRQEKAADDQMAADEALVAAYEANPQGGRDWSAARRGQRQKEYMEAKARIKAAEQATRAQAKAFGQATGSDAFRMAMAGMGGGIGGMLGAAGAFAGANPLGEQPGVPLPPGFGTAFGDMAKMREMNTVRDKDGKIIAAPAQSDVFAMYAGQVGRNFGGMLGGNMSGLAGLLAGAGSLGRGIGGAIGGGMGFRLPDADEPSRFLASIMDPASAMAQQQVDILNAEDVGQQQLAKLDSIKGVLDSILAATKEAGGGGVAGAVQAVLGGGFGAM